LIPNRGVGNAVIDSHLVKKKKSRIFPFRPGRGGEKENGIEGRRDSISIGAQAAKKTADCQRSGGGKSWDMEGPVLKKRKEKKKRILLMKHQREKIIRPKR